MTLEICLAIAATVIVSDSNEKQPKQIAENQSRLKSQYFCSSAGVISINKLSQLIQMIPNFIYYLFHRLNMSGILLVSS